jgi:hypothetical protein
MKEKMLQRQYTALETPSARRRSRAVAVRPAREPAQGRLGMTYTAQARSRYTADAVATASPARLLVMLYDRWCWTS